jgi:hypothetical protein
MPSRSGIQEIFLHLQSGDILFHVVWTMDEKGFITIMGYLIYSVAANSTWFHVIQDFQLLVQIQLLVQQLDQLLKTASGHNASQSALSRRESCPDGARHALNTGK